MNFNPGMNDSFKYHLLGIARSTAFMFIVFIIWKGILNQKKEIGFFGGDMTYFFGMAVLMSVIGGVGIHFINEWVKQGR